MKLAFAGDIMPFGQMDLHPGTKLREFLAGSDALIANLEGCIVPAPRRRILFGLRHSLAVIDFLEELAPETRIVLSCANNHAADYGFQAFAESCAALEERGIEVIGRRDEPSIVLGGSVSVTACTSWSNQRCRYLATLEEVGEYVTPAAKMNILFPHWGHEMELFPRADQVKRARDLLIRWEAIVGHHSHCPQPVTSNTRGGRRLVAYSLGDFTSGLVLDKYRHGIVLRVRVGPDSQGRWRAGEVEWAPTRIDLRRQLVEVTPER
jgi:poly-gamma-glutamate capsule biosynthesis protein CapA/YwtB (metallophosphatase superfamily)